MHIKPNRFGRWRGYIIDSNIRCFIINRIGADPISYVINCWKNLLNNCWSRKKRKKSWTNLKFCSTLYHKLVRIESQTELCNAIDFKISQEQQHFSIKYRKFWSFCFLIVTSGKNLVIWLHGKRIYDSLRNKMACGVGSGGILGDRFCL